MRQCALNSFRLKLVSEPALVHQGIADSFNTHYFSPDMTGFSAVLAICFYQFLKSVAKCRSSLLGMPYSPISEHDLHLFQIVCALSMAMREPTALLPLPLGHKLFQEGAYAGTPRW
jgi:hypothetical protein